MKNDSQATINLMIVLGFFAWIVSANPEILTDSWRDVSWKEENPVKAPEEPEPKIIKDMKKDYAKGVQQAKKSYASEFDVRQRSQKEWVPRPSRFMWTRLGGEWDHYANEYQNAQSSVETSNIKLTDPDWDL